MTEPARPAAGHLVAVRRSYDTVAADYARLVVPPAGMDPLSRAMLAAFAELVRESGGGVVADLGCGPGKVTAHLAALGLPAFGVDVSGEMIALARRSHPELRFQQGEMAALELPDRALGGILAWYSVHHTPDEQLPALFAEFHRVLAPGGHLLLGGHTGDGQSRPGSAYGHPVSYTSYLVPGDRLVELLAGAGFTVTTRLDQARPERPERGYVSLLAHA
ncbi:class I SAM-dependent DNA methyltransferase [Kitasatospora cathayae]|uniref:Class I SAM-dependent methyltransferase n=1 Tax=Kitasatospora cathayae TaxID=3004092 RepID=A0ABY7QHN0_9ACTN|nr:class I SAM-dependent methyltransferase [Kitasatospora sp. HUAS 3-15]WBP91804.1 class I SAM-dependent methyltransferase [Kitasatospora sp. HUAS 3-15]